jgi:hypothetical protein
MVGGQEGLKVLCGKVYSKKKKDKIPHKRVHQPQKKNMIAKEYETTHNDSLAAENTDPSEVNLPLQ